MASKIRSNYLPELSALTLGRNRPSMVTVNLTSRCEQRCIYCEIGQGIPSSRNERLTLDDLFWIINEMALTGIKRISLCGGEPFLFDGIIDLVEYAGEKNIRCTITSNGMAAFKLEEGELECLKRNRTLVNISIDSFAEDIQSHTRGIPGAVEKPLRSIEVLSSSGIPATILTVITRYNFDTLYSFLKDAFSRGVRQVLFQPVISFSNYPDRPPVSNKARFNVPPEKLPALTEQLRMIHRFEKTHNINTNVYRILPWISHYIETAYSGNGKWFFEGVLNKFYCREVDAIIDIAYDGGIQPCGLALSGISILNNRDKGLLDLWEEATATLKEELQNNKFRDICNGCCHHFSRNMMASVIRYPISNRMALAKISMLIMERAVTRAYKKVIFLS